MLKGDLFFTKRTLKVRTETSMMTIMAVLNQVGVLIDGRYEVTAVDDGTLIEFLATDLQWYLVGFSLDHKDDIEKGTEDILKKWGL